MIFVADTLDEISAGIATRGAPHVLTKSGAGIGIAQEAMVARPHASITTHIK